MLNPIFRKGSHLRVFGLTYQLNIVFDRPWVSWSPFPTEFHAMFFEFVGGYNEIYTMEFARRVLARFIIRAFETGESKG